MFVLLLIVICHAGVLLILIGNLLYLQRHTAPSMQGPFPRLSVLIPARNEAHALPRLLASLLRQDHPDFEVIVYDDQSEDSTWAVLESQKDERIVALRGDELPHGWIGKVHALYQATRRASGARYLFLDADAELTRRDTLRRISSSYEALPQNSVLTALPLLRGNGLLLVSLIPNALLVGLPWPLVRGSNIPSLGALNGQCWLIDAGTYHALDPHVQVKNEILEDILIGRYLKDRGITPVLQNMTDDLTVRMYANFAQAWKGLRKNAYLSAGGSLGPFFAFFLLYGVVFVAPPFISAWFLISLYAFKITTDRLSGFPWYISLFAPVSYVLGALVQLDSAYGHARGRITWKDRPV